MALMKSGTMTLPCEMTEEQVIQKAQELAAAVKEHEDHAATTKDIAGKRREELAAIEDRTRKLCRMVTTRTEERKVEVSEVLFGREVNLIRLDTGEVVETRPAKEDDVTASLFEEGVS